jgi:hypothetical protein
MPLGYKIERYEVYTAESFDTVAVNINIRTRKERRRNVNYEKD